MKMPTETAKTNPSTAIRIGLIIPNFVFQVVEGANSSSSKQNSKSTMMSMQLWISG
jgi:hypothetical protein